MSLTRNGSFNSTCASIRECRVPISAAQMRVVCAGVRDVSQSVSQPPKLPMPEAFRFSGEYFETLRAALRGYTKSYMRAA